MSLHDDLIEEAMRQGMPEAEALEALTAADAIVQALDKMDLAFHAFQGLLPPDHIRLILTAVAERMLGESAENGRDFCNYLLQLMVLAEATVRSYTQFRDAFLATRPSE